MKFTTTFLALFATVAASTFSSQVDARIGEDRNLNSNDGRPDGRPDGPDKKYTVYFANSCDKIPNRNAKFQEGYAGRPLWHRRLRKWPKTISFSLERSDPREYRETHLTFSSWMWRLEGQIVFVFRSMVYLFLEHVGRNGLQHLF